MRVLSLFSGVGGFDLGLEAAGWRTVFQCEIDPHCQQTLAHHWPDTPRWDDITTLTGRHVLDHCGGVDVVAWGSPCQDLSVAGKRAGLSGERSGLFHHGIRIIKEIKEITNGQLPIWSIWENVAGALSSNKGADFGQVLYEMDEAGACFSEWAVLDAQHFGVPQRRRRVFVISCFDSATAERCGTPLLPVSESGAGNPAKGSAARKATTGEIANCLRVGSGVGERGDGTDNLIPVEPDIVNCLRSGGAGGVPSSRGEHLVIQLLDARRIGDVRVYDEPVQTLSRRMGTGGGQVPMLVGESPIAFGHTQNLDPQASTVHTPSLRVGGGGAAVLASTEVRRLTPIECERLMGWPDDHTLFRADGKRNSDTTRYKMCGNGVVASVATWIAQQINQHNPTMS